MRISGLLICGLISSGAFAGPIFNPVPLSTQGRQIHQYVATGMGNVLVPDAKLRIKDPRTSYHESLCTTVIGQACVYIYGRPNSTYEIQARRSVGSSSFESLGLIKTNSTGHAELVDTQFINPLDVGFREYRAPYLPSSPEATFMGSAAAGGTYGPPTPLTLTFQGIPNALYTIQYLTSVPGAYGGSTQEYKYVDSIGADSAGVVRFNASDLSKTYRVVATDYAIVPTSPNKSATISIRGNLNVHSTTVRIYRDATCSTLLTTTNSTAFLSGIYFPVFNPNGLNSISANYDDLVGGPSVCHVLARYTHQEFAPQVNDLFVNVSAVSGANLNVSVYADVSNASQMALTSTSNCGGTLNWQPYQFVSAFTLPAVSGNQIIYAKFKSISGIATACLATSIDYYPKAPVVTNQSVSQTALVGSVLSLAVVTTGTAPLTYIWRRNGIPIPGENAPILYIDSVQGTDAGNYTLFVSNPVSSVTSAPIIISVVGAPSIALQPINATVSPGAPASFTASATGSGTLNYQWMKNGADIPGATTNIYSIPSAQLANMASYSIRVSSIYGSVTSQPATLTVNAPPQISNPPQNLTVVQGSPASFAVNAIGPNLAYQWIKNPNNINSAINNPFVIASAQLSDAGAYSVKVTNPFGFITSANATLAVVVPPTISGHPISKTVANAAATSFSVAASTSSGVLSYQWTKNGADLPGATSSTYSIASANGSHVGNYLCRVKSTLNSISVSLNSNSASLTVNSPPSITMSPSSQTLAVGSPASFSVSAVGSGMLAYQWTKGGSNINGATNATYVIASVQSTDAGTYAVRVTNANGTSPSSDFIITTNNLPNIVTPPLSQTVNQGSATNFAVNASGSGSLSYQWYRAPLENIAGATNPSYSIPNTQISHAGNYIVCVKNTLNGTEVTNCPSARLTVNSPPVIQRQPSVAIAALVGDTINIRVTALGSGVLSYQWKKNGVVIPNGGRVTGATSPILTIASSVSTDAGNYSVSITNTLNAVVSPAVTSTTTALQFVSSTEIDPLTLAPFTVSSLGYKIRNDMANEIDLGTAQEDAVVNAITFTIHNTRPTAQTIGSVTVSNSLAFTLSTTGIALNLAGNASTNFSLRLNTASPGIKQALITIHHPTNPNFNFSFPVGGLVWGASTDLTDDYVDPAPATAAQYLQWGSELAAFVSAKTAAQYNALRSSMSLSGAEKRIYDYFQSKGAMGTTFAEYILAAKRSVFCRGAYLAAQNYLTTLNSMNANDLMTMVSLATGSITNDPSARSRAAMVTALAQVSSARAQARTYFQLVLIKGVVENSPGLNAFGRIFLLQTFFKAYMMSNPTLGEASEVVSQVFARISDPVISKPMLDSWISQFPEIALGGAN